MTQYGTCGVLSSVESSVQRGVVVFTAGLASQLHHWLLQQRRHGGWSVRTLSNDTDITVSKGNDPQFQHCWAMDNDTKIKLNKDNDLNKTENTIIYTKIPT